ncbi:MAG: DEAD/DEAH box helicase [Nitrososphaeria archaeon]|nr:DEAD/DEAH box helicase [Nitrososphaeria archaeon]
MNNVFKLFPSIIQKAIEEFGFKEPTEPQIKAIPSILNGENVLLVAPTGTGKTEAAFFPILSKIISQERLPGIKLLYITPLRALNRDLLDRLEWWCKKFDLKLAVRHGDTSALERSKQSIAPPDILITTPETFQAILPAKRIRKHLKAVKWVIVDEVHELAEDKRGAQLSLGLERLRENVGEDFQIIGLSATIGSPENVAKFLVGTNRDCKIIDVRIERQLKVEIVYPHPAPQDYHLASKLFMFPEVVARLRLIRKLIEEHNSTLVFTNTRIENEILGSRFKVWESEYPISVHHGSLSKSSRVKAERELKEGILKGIICTSSLEMGIDIGRLDLVIQYNSPRQVTRLVQRIGRSGHKIGMVAKGVIITQDSDDFWESIIIAKRAIQGVLEKTNVIDKPLDVLAHQLVGILLDGHRLSLEEVFELVKRSYVYRNLTKEEFMMVLNYLSERKPSLARVLDNNFRKPVRIGPLYQYYFNTLSMIPEEKHYIVIDENGEPVGTLDESFVTEYGEVGLKFILRGAIWKVENISDGKVYVRLEDDPTGAIPFWVGEEIPVPYEIANEVGILRRKVEEYYHKKISKDKIISLLCEEYSIPLNECEYGLKEIFEHIEKGFPVPTDKTVTIEKWKEFIIIQCCWGHLVNRTLGRALSYILSNRFGYPVGVQFDPYRIVLRASWLAQKDVIDALNDIEPGKLEEIVRKELLGSGIFKRHFVNAAKKFGAISKDANLSDISIQKLMEALKDTAVTEEALRSTLRSETDIENSRKVLEMIRSKEIRLEIVLKEELSPIARVGMEELSRRTEIVPPERLKHIIVQIVKARLLEEAFTVVCTECWNYVENFRVKKLLYGISCPKCGSKKIGLYQEDEEKIRKLTYRMKAGIREPPKQLKRMYSKIMKTAQVIEKYGGIASFVLAEPTLTLKDVEEILEKHKILSDELVNRIIELSKRNLRKRFM